MTSSASLRSSCAIIALVTAFMGATANADTIPAFSTQTSATLQDLATNGGTLTIGDLTFSDFSFFENGLTSFDPSQIHVTATFANGTYFLTWDGNMSFLTPNGSGPSTADLALKYTVTAGRGLIDAIDAAFTGSGQPEGGTFIAVDESARDGNGNVVGTTHLNLQKHSDTFAITPPQHRLDVTKDITFATTNGGLVTLSEVAQSFHPIPEPSTTALLGVMGLGLLYRRLRR